MKEIMELIQPITFVRIEEVYQNRKQFREIYQRLPEDAQEIYKWYFYHQLCLLTQKQYELKDLMWEYLSNHLNKKYAKLLELELNHQYRIFEDKKKKMNKRKNKL